MPANRVLVNTPAPQGSTGITTNVFPSMTLGCGAVAGNITSRTTSGPQHLINIKRLAYVVRKPEEAFEMPLDYNMAPDGVRPPDVVGPVDRNAVWRLWSGIWLRAASQWRRPRRRPASAAVVRLLARPTPAKRIDDRKRGGRSGRPVPGRRGGSQGSGGYS